MFGTPERTRYPNLIVLERTNEKIVTKMDKNLKMRPKADEKFEKRDAERTKGSQNGT